jgi:hypothetical protein
VQSLNKTESDNEEGLHKLTQSEMTNIVDIFTDALDISGESLRRTKRLVNTFILFHQIAYYADPDQTSENDDLQLQPIDGGSVSMPSESSSGKKGGEGSSSRSEMAKRVDNSNPATAIPAGALSETDNAEPSKAKYSAFLMAAVSAIQVLHPEKYGKLASGREDGKSAIREWFGLEESSDGAE